MLHPASRRFAGTALALALVTCEQVGAGVSETEELLVAVRLAGHPPGVIIPVLARGNQTLVPLGALCDALGLAVRVDPDRGRADGFIIEPQRGFELDLRRGTARSGSVEVMLAADDFLALSDDIYLELALAARLLPVDLAIERLAAVLEVRPREALPIELRDARRRRGHLTSEDPAGPRGLPIDHPRALFTVPVVDLAGSVSSREGSGTAATASTLLSGDLLYLDASLFLSGTDRDWNEPRWTLGRRDPGGRALGPIGATEAVAGDITFPRLPLVASTASGRGMFASNRPLDRATSFDRHTFRGALPPGWDLELYRDEELVAWVADPNTGFYEIPDVELRWGPNRFRLVFYGPRGERREEVVTFDVGEGQLTPGATEWRLAYLDEPTGLGSSRGSFEIEHGLSRRLSLGASISTVDVAGADRRYAGLNLRGALGRFLVGIEGSRSLDESTGAWRLTARTHVGRVRLGLEHEVFEAGFVSDPLLERFGPVRSRSLLRADGGIRIGLRQGLSLGTAVVWELLLGGGSVLDASVRLGWSAPGVFVTNQVTWTKLDGVDRSSETGRGTLLVSRHAGFGTLRAEIDYEVVPDSEVAGAALALERRLKRDLLLSVEASRSLRPGGTYEVLAELRRVRGTFGYGFGVGWSELTGALAQASVSLGVARDPHGERWVTDAQPLAAAGAVSVRAFLDLDGSGTWTEGDEPLEGVGFVVDRTVPRARTDAAGAAFIGRLPAWRPVRVAVASQTLEDPLQRPANEGVEVTPRPGVVASVDLAVQMTGELTGTVYLREGSRSSGRGGVRVELRNLADGTVLTARSAYDGFFELSRIPPGRYLLSVPFDELVRLEADGVVGNRIEVASSGGIFDGRNLVVQREPAATPTPIESAPLEAALLLAEASRTATVGETGQPDSGAPDGESWWALQVASMSTAAGARDVARAWEARLGRPVQITPVELDGLGTRYRVYAVGFPTAGEARDQLEQLAADGVTALGPLRLGE